MSVERLKKREILMYWQ